MLMLSHPELDRHSCRSLSLAVATARSGPRASFSSEKYSVQMEQRVNWVKLGKTATEAHAILKEMYRSKCLSHTQIFEWLKRFKDGHETTEDDPRPGRPSTSKTDNNI